MDEKSGILHFVNKEESVDFNDENESALPLIAQFNVKSECNGIEVEEQEQCEYETLPSIKYIKVEPTEDFISKEGSKYIIDQIKDEYDKVWHEEDVSETCNSHLVKTEAEDLNNGNLSTVCKQELSQYEGDLLTSIDSIHYVKTETSHDFERRYIINQIKHDNEMASHTEDISATGVTPLQIMGDIVIEHDNNQMEVDDENPTIDHVRKRRQIIGVRLNKSSKTSAERGREFRARKALLKQQSKQQQKPDAIVEIATEDIRSADQSDDNQAHGPSGIRTIAKRAKAAEATRRWREKTKSVSESSKKQANTAAQRMREYRERKKLDIQRVEKKELENNIATTSCSDRKNQEITMLVPTKQSRLKCYQPKEFKCNLCDYGSSQRVYLMNHINSTHLKLKPYECSLCRYSSSFKHNLQNHIDSAHLKLKPYKCNLCDYSSSQKSNVRIHMNAVHLKLAIYKCDLCEYSSSVNSYLLRHINSAHLKLRPHKCSFCDYSSSQKSNIKFHVKAVHLKLAIHKCDLCEYSSSVKSYLQRHINSTHLKLRPHKCELCDYRTSNKTNIRVHMNSVHLNLRLHKCDFCDYSSSIKSHLQRHKNSAHLKLKPHKCSLCDYSSSQKSNTRVHMKTVHSKLAIHKCDLCSYRSSVKSYIQKHINSSHLKLRPHKCSE